MVVHWQRLKAAELNERAAAGAVVLLPVASTEQHGPHLATGVDCFLCGAVCERAAEKAMAAGLPVVVAPVLWPGLAEHHMAMGGSFTLSLATYQALLLDLGRAIERAGFKRLVIVNGHGGNMAALNAMSAELTRALALELRITTYFLLAEPAFAEILEDQSGVRHACEAETSMMMRLHPDLVDRGRLEGAHGPSASSTAGVLDSGFHRWRSFAEISPSGVVGDARRATAEKGEKLLEAAAAALAERLVAEGRQA